MSLKDIFYVPPDLLTRDVITGSFSNQEIDIGHITTSPQDYGTIYLIVLGEPHLLMFLSQC